MPISVSLCPPLLNDCRSGATGCLAFGAANAVCPDRARQMRRGVRTSDASPSPSGIGRAASQVAHVNPRLSRQGLNMSRQARLLPAVLARPLRGRSVPWLLVCLSLVASPVLAEGKVSPGPSSRQADETVRASYPIPGNQAGTLDQPRSGTCLNHPQALVLFDRLDRDSDGRLTRADIRRREAGRDRVRVVAPDRHTARFDLDGDGLATRQEVVTASSCPGLMRYGQMPIGEQSAHNLEGRERPAD